MAGLTGNHADPVATRAVERALALLSAPMDRIAEGILLMRADTLAAQARSYADANGDRERSIRALLDDVATGFGHLVDCYPGVRRINANRLALGLQADRAPAVEAELRAIAAVAEESPAVAPSAREALRVGRGTVDDLGETVSRPLDLDAQAVFIKARGETIAARLLDATNFVSGVAQRAGSEAAGLGADSWREIRKRVPKAAGKGFAKGTEKGLEKAIPGGIQAVTTLGALAFAHAIAGNWGVVAALVPMLGPHARKLKSILRELTKVLREDEDDPPDDDGE